MELSQLQPHPRGLAFETFLKNLFDAFGLEAREPFAFEWSNRWQFSAFQRNLYFGSEVAERANRSSRVAYVSWQDRAKGRVDERFCL
jgi:hypothetical protein